MLLINQFQSYEMLSSYTPIGKNLIQFESIGSTNDYAIELLSKSNPTDGTVITASFQTNGHGQFDRKWESNQGENLLLSLILYPQFIPTDQQFILSMVTVVSIIEYLRAKNIPAKVKWPNDIYVDNNKIAGILIKNSVVGSKINSSVIGIGLNINQKEFESNVHSTSLSLETSSDFDVNTCLTDFCLIFEKIYNDQKSENKMTLYSTFEQLIYGLNEKITLQKNQSETNMIIKGIDGYGRLKLVDNQNQVSYLTHGEGTIKY